MCLKLSISRMIADRLPSGRGHARASLRRLLEETAPIAQTGQGIDGGEPDQIALHRRESARRRGTAHRAPRPEAACR